MIENREGRDEFIEAFRKQLEHVDDFIQTVLNAHLEVEGQLEKFLDRIFFHPEYIEDGRLQFFNKVHVARAYTTESHNAPEWSMMLALNTIRNKVAHRSRNKVLEINMVELTKSLAKTHSSRDRASIKNLSHKDVVVYSPAICSGFLLILEEQLARAKGEPIDDEN